MNSESARGSVDIEAEPAVQPVVQTRGLAIIAIDVTDIDRAERFYTEMLGFERGEQMLSPGVTLSAGDCSIYLRDEQITAGREQVKHPEITLCLVVPGVRNAYERLREAGVKITGELVAPSEYFATMAIADPDGNPIEIWGKP